MVVNFPCSRVSLQSEEFIESAYFASWPFLVAVLGITQRWNS